ncbi:hypothetical protein P872_11910 [Rhodonellum psychrophilum GCM71 = DSM 17998]|uniref:Carboxyltransferase domain-containing protein n=2 Tax=Rhodonellum TaxID=336827 RepID=U5BK93_9BACT|nr:MULTISPECIES: biotin-dependent carboxyltransferase family protein [Rhodonellum]ERM80855.1 hypothetical protein P872_11910 [Rhodonellum psychrophilum GCM71 = DSM 17998]SDZ52533.1 biotin-dependent carboxylase uncharacterized domain-containing protein [Rhodonellum ikkaensis]
MIKEPGQITFFQPGILTTVQDQGRKKMSHFGIPYAGAMDQFSYFKANQILSNQEGSACLEMTLMGPEMGFESETQIVFTGATAVITQNGVEVPMGKILQIKAGDRVKVIRFEKGQWLYMGIKGGIESELIGGSRSFYDGITRKSKISKGDKLFYLSDPKPFVPVNSYAKIKADWFGTDTIQVFKGPEWRFLTKSQQEILTQKPFTLSKLQNRMGIHLNEAVINTLSEILTAPVYPGTVQLTPSGKPIVLMRDAQVTGGYPRILHVCDSSLNVLSQKRPGEKIVFSLI